MSNTLFDNEFFQKTPVFEALSQTPFGFIDVGARGGIHEIIDPASKLTAVMGFEPNKEEQERLLKEVNGLHYAMYEVEAQALAEKEKDATIYLLEASTNDSLLPPSKFFIERYNTPKFVQTGSSELRTTTLDKILFEERISQPFWGEFIKLDTQGSEFDILEGAKKTLQERCVAVTVEVEFFQIYQNQKLFSDIEIFLRDLGFSFYGFDDMFLRSRRRVGKKNVIGRERLQHTDAIFFKDPYNEKKVEISQRQKYALFLSAMLFGYYDFAFEIAEKTWAKTKNEQKNVLSMIESYAFADPQDAIEDVEAVLKKMKADPENANIHLGKFFDKRRSTFDYNDILDIG